MAATRSNNTTAGTLIPRSVLFNAALYSFSALVYSIAIFSLEIIRPGKYVFAKGSSWRDIFNYIAICSWPILLFGALILSAVRIGANVRRKRNNKEQAKKEQNQKDRNIKKSNSRPAPPSTRPPGAPPLSATPTPPPPALVTEDPNQSAQSMADSTADAKLKKGKKKRKRSRSAVRVPRGYVSVTRTQRLFASVGFLWVAIGLACTSASAVIVFLGLRDRSTVLATEIGVEGNDTVKEWVIPCVVGGVMAAIYAVLALTTIVKFWRTVTAPERTHRERRARAQARASANGSGAPSRSNSRGISSGGGDLESAVGRMADMDRMLADESDYENDLYPSGKKVQMESRKTPDIHVTAPGLANKIVPSRSGNRFSGTSSLSSWATEPDAATVDSLMTQLKNMGYRNEHQNIAALQAASFDLKRAAEKLANVQQS